MPKIAKWPQLNVAKIFKTTVKITVELGGLNLAIFLIWHAFPFYFFVSCSSWVIFFFCKLQVAWPQLQRPLCWEFTSSFNLSQKASYSHCHTWLPDVKLTLDKTERYICLLGGICCDWEVPIKRGVLEGNGFSRYKSDAKAFQYSKQILKISVSSTSEIRTR